MAIQVQTTSEILKTIKEHEGETISVAEIVARFREGGFALMLIIFASPTALPLPAVGLASVMAIPIMFFSLQLALGKKHIWVPKWLAKKRISMSKMNKIIDMAVPYLQKMEKFLKPRVKFLSTRAGEHLIGLICVICTLSVFLPIPLSNTIPSMGIVIMSLGLLSHDGFAIIVGAIIGVIGVTLTIMAILLGAEAVKAMLF